MNTLKHLGTVELNTERLILKRISLNDSYKMFTNFAGDNKFLKSNNEIIGTVYLLTACNVSKVASISYCLGYDYWGNGYICESVNAVIDFAFNKIGFNRIEAYHAESNVQSARVLQKIGMQKEGVLRKRCKTYNGYEDCTYYSILKDEYINDK